MKTTNNTKNFICLLLSMALAIGGLTGCPGAPGPGNPPGSPLTVLAETYDRDGKNLGKVEVTNMSEVFSPGGAYFQGFDSKLLGVDLRYDVFVPGNTTREVNMHIDPDGVITTGTDKSAELAVIGLFAIGVPYMIAQVAIPIILANYPNEWEIGVPMGPMVVGCTAIMRTSRGDVLVFMRTEQNGGGNGGNGGFDQFDPAAAVTVNIINTAQEHSVYLDIHHWSLRNSVFGWPDDQKPHSLGVLAWVPGGSTGWLETLPYQNGKPVVINLDGIVQHLQPGATLLLAFVAYHPTQPNPDENDGRYWFNVGRIHGAINGQIDSDGIGTVNGQPLQEAVGAGGQGLGYYTIVINGPQPQPVTKFTLATSMVGQGSVSGGGIYEKGTAVTIQATPATGWQFSNWTGTISGTNNPATVTMNSDVTATAVFTQIPPTQFTLSTNVSGSGSVAGANVYNKGDTATVTATPSSGWQFSNWTGTLNNNINPTTVLMDGNKIVTAVFTQVIPTVGPTITGQPQSISKSVGQSASFTITVTGSATLIYQWQKLTGTNWANVSTGAALNFNSVVLADAGDYRCVVTNNYGTATSNPATLSVGTSEGKMIVDLDWHNSQLNFTINAPTGYPSGAFKNVANQSSISSVGLELYHQVGGEPWVERQLFTFNNSWPVSGTVNKFRPQILRFEVVANNSSGYGDVTKLEVRINGRLIPRVADPSNNMAYQVDVSTL